MDTKSVRWFDRSAPYGPNGYAFGRGEYVKKWDPVRSFGVETPLSDIIEYRGVVELADGRLYVCAVRRPGREDVDGNRYIVSRFRNISYPDLVRMVWENERCFTPPGERVRYRTEVARITG